MMSSLFDGIVGKLAAGTTVSLETSLGSAEFNVADELAAPQGLLTKFLRPRITVRSGDVVIATVAPAGDPTDAPPWLLIGAAGLVVCGALVWRLVR